MNIPSVVKNGLDTWVDSANVHKRHGGKDWVRLQTGTERGLLWMPVPARAQGRTIATATLTGHAHGALSSQALTLTPVASKWRAKTATWSNQPSTIGTAVTASISAKADADEVVWDVTSLVQQIANGQENLGWRITTNAATEQKFASFNSGKSAWRLDITYVDGPDVPTNMSPNGTVVSVPLPVSTFDYTTFGGDDSDLAKISFQVDKGNNGSVDFDSGFVTATTPQIDLNTSGLTGITAGTQVAYRYKVQDAGGQSSDYCDWIVYTYQPLPTLTLDSPAAGVLYDPTSDILAHISTTNLEAFRVRVTDGTDRTLVRYDSEKQPADDPSNIAWGLPLYQDSFSSNFFSVANRIFVNDGNYQINVRAFDDYDREATPGAPSFVELWTTVHFTDTGSVGSVSTFTATQPGSGPVVTLTWTDTAAPDAYILTRDGDQIGRLDPADVVVGASTYSIDDMPAPGVEHTYEIRRLTNGVGRSNPVSATITVSVEGIWFVRKNGDSVVIDGNGIDQLQALENRLTFSPIHLNYDIDILTGYRGITGPITGSVEDDEDRTFADAEAVLKAIKKNPGEPVQVVYANVSKPMQVSQLDWQPSADDDAATFNRHVVRCNVQQIGDFDYQVG